MARKKKQSEIPGFERPTHPELDEIAQPYVDALYERMALEKKERELKAQLLERMKQLEVPLYIVEDEEGGKYEIKTQEGEMKLVVKRLARKDSEPDGDPGEPFDDGEGGEEDAGL